jgi:hypothetical protein
MATRTRLRARHTGTAATWRHAQELGRGALASLDALYTRSEARAESAVPSDGWASHGAVLDRLAANIRVAQGRGWTSCAIERVHAPGRLSAWGIPPGDSKRHAVPDWAMGPA